MAKLNACIASSGRSPRSRPSMTPSQIRAYLLARETLRRMGLAATGTASQPTEARK
jgi:hypothetical protein